MALFSTRGRDLSSIQQTLGELEAFPNGRWEFLFVRVWVFSKRCPNGAFEPGIERVHDRKYARIDAIRGLQVDTEEPILALEAFNKM